MKRPALADLHLGGGRGFLALVFALAQAQRHHQRHRCRLFIGHEHIDHAMRQRLELADGLAELLARFGIFRGRIEQHLHRAASLGAMGGDGFVGHLLDQRKTVIDGSDGIGGRNFDILERDFRGAQAIDGRIIARGDAFGFFIDEENRNALVVALATRGARSDDQCVRHRRAEHDGLCAVQHITGALFLRARQNVGEIVASLPLGEGERHQRFAARDFGEPFFLLRIAAAIVDKAAADHDRLREGLDDEGFAEFLHHNHRIDRPAAEPAIGFGQGCCHQSQFGEGLPVLRIPARIRARDFLERLEIIMVSQKFGDRIAQQRLFFGEGEIHCYLP